jgi:miniconductance mechanosensitive channel
MQELIYKYIDKLLDIRDIYLSKAVGVFVMLLIITALAILAFYLTRLITNHILRRFFMNSHNKFLHIVAENHGLPLFAHLAMSAVFWWGSRFVIRHEEMYTSYLAIFISKISQLYLFMAIVIILTRLIQTINTYYETRFDFAHERPIASYLNVAIFCVWVISAILIISFFANQSPLVLLTGIGAVSAVFLLVFKDILLGIVASIQATALNIVRVDDRVSLDKYNIDGIILSMAISTIKIRNNDNTIITIPTYMITSEILKNWRGLSDFGARRIKRAMYLDINSIKVCDESLYKKLSAIIDVSAIVDVNVSANAGVINLNLYRNYIESYLRRHKDISKDYSILVRHLAPTPNGLPVEIHAFTHCVIWDDYERIQADIFEHCFAMLSIFELKVLQKAS